MPKGQLTRELEKELMGRETEPHEIIYFKIYRRQIPVIEQALEAGSADAGGPINPGGTVSKCSVQTSWRELTWKIVIRDTVAVH